MIYVIVCISWNNSVLILVTHGANMKIAITQFRVLPYFRQQTFATEYTQYSTYRAFRSVQPALHLNNISIFACHLAGNTPRLQCKGKPVTAEGGGGGKEVGPSSIFIAMTRNK